MIQMLYMYDCKTGQNTLLGPSRDTGNSYMSWFFSPIKSTDTNGVLLADNSTTAVSHAFPFNRL